MEYHLLRDGAEQGPFTIGQLRSMWSTGSLTGETLYWVEGAPEWQPLRELLSDLEPQETPPSATGGAKPYPSLSIPTARPARIVTAGSPISVAVQSPKSRGIYIILGLFLGLLGVHNFYAGRVREGAVQAGVSILLCWTVFAPVCIALWAIYELFTVTEDGEGAPFV